MKPSLLRPTSRSAAQARVDQIESFQRELALIDADHVVHVSPSQRESLETYHRRVVSELTREFGADDSESGRQLSLGMRLVSLVGAASLSAAVFLIFYHFWFALSLWIQEALLGAAPLATFALVVVVREKDSTGYFSKLSAALCFSVFVLNVVMTPMLLGLEFGATQVLLCTLLAFVLAYWLKSRTHLVPAIIGVLVYIAAIQTELRHAPWWRFYANPENLLLPSFILMAIPACFSQRNYPDFGTIYRIFGMGAVFSTLFALATWPSLSYLQLDPATIVIMSKVGIVVSAQFGLIAGIRFGLREATLMSGMALVAFLLLEAWTWLFALMPAYVFACVMSIGAIGGLYGLTTIRRRLNAERLI